MTKRILDATATRGQYVIVVWLDIAKVGQDGATPDASYVSRYRFDAAVPEGLTAAQYRQRILAEVKRRAAADLDRLNARTLTALVGQEFE
jgi:hypothetical protein